MRPAGAVAAEEIGRHQPASSPLMIGILTGPRIQWSRAKRALESGRPPHRARRRRPGRSGRAAVRQRRAGEETARSDVDVCLVLTEAAAARGADKRREYLGAFDLDVHVFQALPLYIRSRVLREGRVLLSKDDDRLYALALRTARVFEDFKPIYRTYLEAVRDARP